VRDEFVSTIDVLPTICAATGVTMGAEDRAVRPGHDLAPLLAGASPQWRKTICAEMHFHTWWMYDPSRAIRDDRWKLIHHLQVRQYSPEFELYDLSNDPDERKNLAADPTHAQTLARLQAELLRWRKATNDPFLEPGLVKKLAAIPGDGQTPIKPWFRGGQSR
jgi:arylsulfatase A-like enzyme